MFLPIRGCYYHVERFGAGEPLLALHGFTGAASNWQQVAGILSKQNYELIAPDLLGHGATDAPQEVARYRMAEAAADVAGILDTLNLPVVNLLGYSMGGRLALYFALAYPNRVKRLVLESASPGLAGAEARKARVEADEALADWIETHGIVPFVERWEQLPMWASQAGLPAGILAEQRAQRLKNRLHGLANSLRGMGTGAQPPLWDELGRLEIPTLLLNGELDGKFEGVGFLMAMRIPNVKQIVAPNVGHNVHLEMPAGFADAILSWLESFS